MGFTPQQVDAMSVWQWFAALNGYIAANTPKRDRSLSESEADELFDWIGGAASGERVLSTQTYWWDERGPVPRRIVRFVVGQ